MNYYNEFNPKAAAWLRELIRAGLIPPGYVDERSIIDVRPEELSGYTQCHFFAGIGGWSLALQLAEWPADRPVWTGSCPCQPFSSAGKQKGKADERHLWPVWATLIRQCKPSVVFGEQVATAITHGWLDEVFDDLEAEGYSCGAAIIPACGVGAPHKRDRLWFVADAYKQGPQGHGRFIEQHDQAGREKPTGLPSENSFWDGAFIDCPDGKQRLIKPSLPLLADGVSNRVAKLHGLGNAIVPQVAAEFIKAYQGGLTR